MSDSLLYKIINGQIINISRVCNLISIQIRSETKALITLHIQSFFRIIKNSSILISSEDMYSPSSKYSEEEFEWDIPGKSIFDESINKHKEDVINAKIKHATINTVGDIDIFLDNGFIIQVIVDTMITSEKYRIFDESEEFVFIAND